MTGVLEALSRRVHVFKLRRRFRTAVIHEGVCACPKSRIAEYVVLFRNTLLINSQVGRYTYIQERSSIINCDIGPFCSIASGVSIGPANHPTTFVSTSPVFYDDTQPLPRFFIRGTIHSEIPRTRVGPDVWIGDGVRIKAGVSLGVGCVVGMGAVVTRDVPPYTIAAGNPCRVLRPRFDQEVINRLIASQWWRLSEDHLRALAPLFRQPEQALAKLSTGVE